MRTLRLAVLFVLPLGILIGPLAAGDASALAAASPSSAMVAHWGSYFGGDATGPLLTPSAFSFPSPVVQVGTSNSTQYALLADGTVWAWGLGTDGELGDGGTTDSFAAPVQVDFPAGVSIASLPTDAMPFDTGLAVDTDGNAWGWGLNSAGQLCGGNTLMQLTPVKIPLPDVTTLAGAGDHAVYDSAGTVYSCGANNYGDLGDGSGASSTTPVPVTGLSGGTVSTLVASYRNSGALLTNGTYEDWGYDDDGQLGVGTFGAASNVPVAVPLPLPVTQVAQGGSITGNGQTLVMLSDGSLRAWGDDQDGQLGDGGTTDQASPVTITPPTGVTYAQLASGGVTSFAISTTGAVYSWGGGPYGQLGDGQRHVSLTPEEVDHSASMISATAQDVEVGLDAPAVTSVSPADGPLGGGVTVQIFGSGFTTPDLSLSQVVFDPAGDTDGSEAFASTSAQVVSDTEIDVTTPSASAAAGAASSLDTTVTPVFQVARGSGPPVDAVAAGAGANDYQFTTSPTPTAPAEVDVSGPASVRYGSQYVAGASAPGADPAATFSLAAGAPAWLSVDPVQGTVSGTAPSGTASFSYAVTATNSQGSDTSAVQTVTVLPGSTSVALSPSPAPKVATGFAVTYAATVVQTSGSGALGGTVSFTDNGTPVTSCTALPLSGDEASCTQSFATVGTVTVAATYGGDPNFTGSSASVVQAVGSPRKPTFTSAAKATATGGQSFTFTVGASGLPTPVIGVVSKLPAGLSFTAADNGTGTISGTPLPGSGGVHKLTVTATNSAGTSEETLTLTVDQQPSFTSARSVTVAVGSPLNFTVRTGGYPAPVITETGSLPAGITFTPNTNNTATLSGTPAAGSNGTYDLTLTASNGVGATASQSFVLTVSP